MSESALASPPATQTAPASPKAGSLRLVDLLQEIACGHEVYFKYVRTAADLMTRDVLKLNLDAKVGDAVKLMKEHHFRHVPLVDTEGGGEAFIGIISWRDIARQISKGCGTAAETESDPQALQAPLSSVVTRKPRSAKPDQEIFTIVNEMIEAKVDCMPVLDDAGALVGILTSTDILHSFTTIGQLQKMTGQPERRRARLIDLKAGHRELDSKMLLESHFKTVGDLMTEKPDCLGPDATAGDAINLMKGGRVRHAPVVDPKNRILGLVADTDILHSLPPAKDRGPAKPGAAAGFRDALFAIDSGDPALKTEVKDFMVPEARLVLVKRSDHMMDALQLLLKGQFAGLLVANDDPEPELAGILTVTDYLRAFCVLGQMLHGG